MNTHLPLLLAGTILFTLLAQARNTQQPLTKTAQLAGLDITMSLRKRLPTPQQSNWPDEPSILTTKLVTVNKKGIGELLRENHITPNVEAYGVVYALNPEVNQLRDIKVLQLQIPTVQGGPALAAIFNSGFTVDLVVDKELKERFVNNVEQVRATIQTVAGFAGNKFLNQAAKESVNASLNKISTTLDMISRRLFPASGHPITTEVLRQLNAEAELLNRLLRNKAAPATSITQEDQDLISVIEKDILIKGKTYAESAGLGAPDRWPEVTVTVKTLRQGKEVPNLRIYYVPQALKGDDGETHSFGVLSSPASNTLFEADYCFWAAIDPNETAVSNEQCVEVRRDRQNEVQLTVNP